MKRIATLTIAMTISACGSGGGGGGNAAAPVDPDVPEEQKPAQPHSMLVADAGALPECTAEAEGWLVYVKAEEKFKACSGAAWADVEVKGEKGDQGAAGAKGDTGANGENGLAITSVDNIKSATTADFCTRYLNVVCTFVGGVAVKYSNGWVQFSGSYLHYEEYDIGGGNKDTDVDTFDTGINICEPKNPWCSLSLMKEARTGSDITKQIWLVYTSASKQFSVVFDVNGNGDYEPGTDEVLETLTTESSIVK